MVGVFEDRRLAKIPIQVFINTIGPIVGKPTPVLSPRNILLYCGRLQGEYTFRRTGVLEMIKLKAAIKRHLAVNLNLNGVDT